MLRNYIAQNAIDAAEKGDFSEVANILNLLRASYSNGFVTPDQNLDAATLSSDSLGAFFCLLL